MLLKDLKNDIVSFAPLENMTVKSILSAELQNIYVAFIFTKFGKKHKNQCDSETRITGGTSRTDIIEI